MLRLGDGRVVFSNPVPPLRSDGAPSVERVNLTLRLSADEGRTWPKSRLLRAGPAAYSSLAQLPDGTILCLYETGEKNFRETLTLARFPVDWLITNP
jgi:sialidase-1